MTNEIWLKKEFTLGERDTRRGKGSSLVPFNTPCVELNVQQINHNACPQTALGGQMSLGVHFFYFFPFGKSNSLFVLYGQ